MKADYKNGWLQELQLKLPPTVHVAFFSEVSIHSFYLSYSGVYFVCVMHFGNCTNAEEWPVFTFRACSFFFLQLRQRVLKHYVEFSLLARMSFGRQGAWDLLECLIITTKCGITRYIYYLIFFPLPSSPFFFPFTLTPQFEDNFSEMTYRLGDYLEISNSDSNFELDSLSWLLIAIQNYIDSGRSCTIT